MLPTLATQGDQALICWLYANGQGVQVGDIITFDHPVLRGVRAMKRVVGMEGDYVLRDTPGGLDGQWSDGIEGWGPEIEQDDESPDPTMIRVPRGHCWVVGDNLSWSRDSRMYGPLPLALIKGKVIAIQERPDRAWKFWKGWKSA